MRDDIQAAYNLLDDKGRGAINGFRVQPTIKKAFAKLEEFVGAGRPGTRAVIDGGTVVFP